MVYRPVFCGLMAGMFKMRSALNTWYSLYTACVVMQTWSHLYPRPAHSSFHLWQVGWEGNFILSSQKCQKWLFWRFWESVNFYTKALQAIFFFFWSTLILIHKIIIIVVICSLYNERHFFYSAGRITAHNVLTTSSCIVFI